MLWLQRFFILALILSGQAIFAYTPQEGNVTATVGPYFYKTDFQGSNLGTRSHVLGGEALIINGDFNDRESLEIAILHKRRSFYREEGPYVLGEETEMIHIALGYRRWIYPYLSAGLTFYSSYSMGVPYEIYNTFPTTPTIDTSARDTTEYGFDFSLLSELWEKDRYALVAGLVYSLSVTNKSNEKGNEFGAFLGLRYFVQEKVPSAKTKEK